MIDPQFELKYLRELFVVCLASLELGVVHVTCTLS